MEFDQVKAQAHFTVVDAMAMALLTGQHLADVLKLKRINIPDCARWVVQNKTETRMGSEITEDLVATCRPKALALNSYSATSTR